MREPNALCTGTDGKQEPVPLYHAMSMASWHTGWNAQGSTYTCARYTHTECPRLQEQGNCGATGEVCNAPAHVTTQTRNEVVQVVQQPASSKDVTH